MVCKFELYLNKAVMREIKKVKEAVIYTEIDP